MLTLSIFTIVSSLWDLHGTFFINIKITSFPDSNNLLSVFYLKRFHPLSIEFLNRTMKYWKNYTFPTETKTYLPKSTAFSMISKYLFAFKSFLNCSEALLFFSILAKIHLEAGLFFKLSELIIFPKSLIFVVSLFLSKMLKYKISFKLIVLSFILLLLPTCCLHHPSPWLLTIFYYNTKITK